MTRRPKQWGRAWSWLLALTLLAAVGCGVAALGVLARRPSYLDLPRATAVRRDLNLTISNGGNLESAEKTVVKCELENYGIGVGGSSMILEVVPDGVVVEKGQVLARLDSSDYEELVRLHEILLLKAQSDEQTAQLDLEVAEIALEEYQGGELALIREGYRSQIVLHEADIQRQKDRLKWSEKMTSNRYISASQFLNEQAILERLQISLTQLRGGLATLDRYSAPVQIKRLEAGIERAREELIFQQLRVLNREEQLTKFRKQVEACTIRAPHAGLVNYVTKWDPNAIIQPGAMVFQKMALFWLPNLEQMEVHIELHESMFTRVKAGQPAKICLTAQPSILLEGHVKSVDPMPKEPKNWWMSREIRNFLVKISIHSPPPGAYPGMTASVEIQTQQRPDALVVPSTAVTIEEGRDVVYVATATGLSRRDVEVAPGDTEYVEVLSGLVEGEEVIIDPTALDPSVVATQHHP